MGRPPNKLRDVENYFTPEPNSGCWLWLGSIDTDGYGTFCYTADQPRTRIKAHRAVWQFFRGEVADKMTLDHLCRNRCCVNPQHLEPVTLRENLRRGFGSPAINARRTHCKQGHLLSGENLFYTKGGKERHCKICNRKNAREYARAKRRALYESPISKTL